MGPGREILVVEDASVRGRVLQEHAEDVVGEFERVVVTHDHATDQALTERLLKRATRYLAVIGSRRKAKVTRDRLAAKGVSEEDIARVRSPAGLDIGAETAEEIAVSILAEMIQVRRTVDEAVDDDDETVARAS